MVVFIIWTGAAGGLENGFNPTLSFCSHSKSTLGLRITKLKGKKSQYAVMSLKKSGLYEII